MIGSRTRWIGAILLVMVAGIVALAVWRRASSPAPARTQLSGTAETRRQLFAEIQPVNVRNPEHSLFPEHPHRGGSCGLEGCMGEHEEGLD